MKLVLRNTPVKIGLITGLAIIAAKTLSALIIYNFFRFDLYLTVVAISFLIIGFFAANYPAQRTLQSFELAESRGMMKCLSNRELSILKMIAIGKLNKEIALSLGIELSTVKTHTHNLYRKIECKNRKEAREKWNQWSTYELISSGKSPTKGTDVCS